MFKLRFFKFKWSMLLHASHNTPLAGSRWFFTTAAIKLNRCIVEIFQLLH